MTGDIMVKHDEAAHRFVVQLEGHAAFLAYRTSGTELDFYHTVVPEAFRGRGIAERVVGAGFEYAKANRLTVKPTCPYISGAYLKRHPEDAPLVRG